MGSPFHEDGRALIAVAVELIRLVDASCEVEGGQPGNLTDR